jgi:hypothetical protein
MYPALPDAFIRLDLAHSIDIVASLACVASLPQYWLQLL